VSELRSSLLGRLVVAGYVWLPARNRLLQVATDMEGGQMTSATLRRVLKTHFKIEVGAHSYGSLLTPGMCDENTVVGRYVSIGPNVRRFGAAHPMDAASMHPYWYNAKLGYSTADHDVTRTALTIGDDTWIGGNVTILPGCRRIGVGAVIGAGSVVTRDVGDFEIVVGNPARPVRERLSPDLRARLLLESPWSLEPAVLKKRLAQYE